MKARALAATTAIVLSMTLSGCITVHGERAVVPAISEAGAKKALKSFLRTNNEANREFDAELNATIEAGPLGAIDQAGLQARKKVHPQGNPDHTPLELTDARFLIPRQAGWPKFFVASSRSNRSEERWLLVFSRDGIDARWKAIYLAVIPEEQVPEFATERGGWVEEIPADARSHLLLAPEQVAPAYTRYLEAEDQEEHGDGSDDGNNNDSDGEGAEAGAVFAAGAHTDELRRQRRSSARTATVWTDFLDQPASGEFFEPVALRTADGGALVFFSSYHHQKQTAAEGLKPSVKDEYAQALMTGTPKRSVTYTYVAAQAVTVPEQGDADGRVEFVSRITGLTKAEAE